MITFTLPHQLRSFVWYHQTWAYKTLFAITADIIQTFFKNDTQLGGGLGFSGILHTLSRRKAFHPHVHYIIPNGTFQKSRGCWKKIRKLSFQWPCTGKAISSQISCRHAGSRGLQAWKNTEWVAQCKQVGRGEPALVYMARYLYRGVISENDIIDHSNGCVTFCYCDSKTGKKEQCTKNALEFLWLILQHVLPKEFRRVRDYGFLHGNAKRTLRKIQLLLKILLVDNNLWCKKNVNCACCGTPMRFIGINRPDCISISRRRLDSMR